jgi:uncharacterized membrane protein YjfL (UPF0719 family)
MMILDWILELSSRLPLFVLGIVLIVGAKQAFHRSFASTVKHSADPFRNPAYVVFLGSFLVALGLAVAGSFAMHSDHLSSRSLTKACMEGFLSMILLWCSILINDRFILYGFKIGKEIHQDRNLGVAFCVAGSTLATGCILNGSFIGYSPSFVREIVDVMAFWLLGQVMLCLAAFVFRKWKTYDVHKLIEYDDNVAVGVDFGCLLLAIGIVVRAGVVGAGGQSLLHEWGLSLLLADLGILVLFLAYYLIGRYLSGGLDVRTEIEMRKNVALSCLHGGGVIAVALMLAALIQR